MKYIAFTLSICMLTTGLSGLRAQNNTEEIIVPISQPGEAGILEVHVHSGQVHVVGSNRNDVVVNVTSIGRKGHSSREVPEGLTRIPNNSMNVRISEDDNHVEVHGDHHNRRSDFEIQVPTNFSLEIHTHHHGDVTVSNVDGEMEISSHHGPITLSNVSGSVVANTHHGAIKAQFNQINAEVPMAFSTYHGNVEVTLPGRSAFSTKIRSAKGEILTDFDMDIQAQSPVEKTRDHDGKYEVSLGGWVYGEVNGGGEEYMFNTYHGDVIIRKN